MSHKNGIPGKFLDFFCYFKKFRCISNHGIVNTGQRGNMPRNIFFGIDKAGEFINDHRAT